MGYRLNKMNTLQFMNEIYVCMEIWTRNLTCEIPDCQDRAIALARHGTTILMCIRHDQMFKSDAGIASALTSATHIWLQYNLAEIQAYAYEDNDQIILVGDSENLLGQARTIMAAAEQINANKGRVAMAEANRQVITFGIIPAPTIRPTLHSLPEHNAHSSMELFG